MLYEEHSAESSRSVYTASFGILVDWRFWVCHWSGVCNGSQCFCVQDALRKPCFHDAAIISFMHHSKSCWLKEHFPGRIGVENCIQVTGCLGLMTALMENVLIMLTSAYLFLLTPIQLPTRFVFFLLFSLLLHPLFSLLSISRDVFPIHPTF